MKLIFLLLLIMTSTIHHPVAVPSRGLIICEMEEESNEPKTILEIGGVARPRPTYIIPPPPRPNAMPTTIGNQPYLGHWKAQHDVVPSPYPAYTEFQEQKIVRLSNANWSGALDKLHTGSLTSKGNSTFSNRLSQRSTHNSDAFDIRELFLLIFTQLLIT